ncbi:MAG: phosphatase PAP2 family protein [Bacteroidota bacterium]
METLISLDTQLFLFLNGLHSPFWDTVMWHISGKWEWVPLYALMLAWMVRRFGVKAIWIVLGAALVVTLADQSSVKLFKNVFERLRPCHNPALDEFVHRVNNKCGGKYGFVSSHAANSFAIAMYTLLVFKNRAYTWFILLWAAIVSYSRIYLGVHYPGDILGGALLGIFLGWLVYRPVKWGVLRPMENKNTS